MLASSNTQRGGEADSRGTKQNKASSFAIAFVEKPTGSGGQRLPTKRSKTTTQTTLATLSYTTLPLHYNNTQEHNKTQYSTKRHTTLRCPNTPTHKHAHAIQHLSYGGEDDEHDERLEAPTPGGSRLQEGVHPLPQRLSSDVSRRMAPVNILCSHNKKGSAKCQVSSVKCQVPSVKTFEKTVMSIVKNHQQIVKYVYRHMIRLLDNAIHLLGETNEREWKEEGRGADSVVYGSSRTKTTDLLSRCTVCIPDISRVRNMSSTSLSAPLPRWQRLSTRLWWGGKRNKQLNVHIGVLSF